MKNIFHKNVPTPLLGVDISNGSVKITELMQKGGDPLVTSCVQVPYAGEHDLVAALQQALGIIEGCGKNAAIALSDTLALTQKIYLDAQLNEREITLHIYDQAAKYFNVPAEALYVDFKILEACETTQKMKSIFWVAAKKAVVDAKVQSLLAAGLSVTIVDLCSFSLQRIYAQVKENHHAATAVAHFDHHVLSLTIFKNDEWIYTVTKAYDEADREKGVPNNKKIELLEQAIRLFYASPQGEPLADIYLSGRYDDAIAPSTLMSIEVKNIQNATFFKNLSEICIAKKYDPNEFLLSFGLAVGRNDYVPCCNLLPWRHLLEKQKIRRFVYQATTTFFVVAILCVFLYMKTSSEISLSQQKIEHLENKASIYLSGEKSFRATDHQVKFIEQQLYENDFFVRLLTFLGENISTSMYLTKIEGAEWGIRIEGHSRLQQEVMSLVQLMGEHFLDKHMSIGEINTDDSEDTELLFSVNVENKK